MRLFAKILRFIFSLYGFAVFLAIMLLLFPLVVLASLLGKIRGGNIIYDICRFWADTCMFLWGIRHKNIFEAPVDPNHAVIFVFNHTSYMDIPLLLKTFRKQHIRILAKAEMAKIPIFGFIYRKAAVLVYRDNATNRAKSVDQLKEVLQKNISIVIAPEGTFNKTGNPLKSFYDGAFRIAIETQTAIQPVIFPDAYDRLSHASIFSLNPGKTRAVYLPKIPVDNYTLADIPLLKSIVYDVMQQKLLEYKAGWII